MWMHTNSKRGEAVKNSDYHRDVVYKWSQKLCRLLHGHCLVDRLSATTATNCLEGYVLPWGLGTRIHTRTEAFSSTNTNSRQRGPCPSQAHRLESCTLSWWANLHINQIQDTLDVKGTVIPAHVNFWGVPDSVNRVAITKWLIESVTLQTRNKQFVIWTDFIF